MAAHLQLSILLRFRVSIVNHVPHLIELDDRIVEIPAHCEPDIYGVLSTSTLAESYELHEPSEALPTATAGPDDMDEQLGYGKRKQRRTANRQ
ncbi:hypothetical protein AZE42_13309 [Rhizopogon vesiculosus]|uniref:Uncharacterized protein n=1 Tax=Rhizopogon vesiculosus TaxID=180088 RepID=A0A1J8QFC7_9AGAM|nr:hypothetical protein AZE42_13309 [Rhizopogon vesiculosus]